MEPDPHDLATDTPVAPDDIIGLSWLETAILALAYGRAAAQATLTLDEITQLARNTAPTPGIPRRTPESQIIRAVKFLQNDGMLTLPGLFNHPSNTPVRPVIPGAPPPTT